MIRFGRAVVYWFGFDFKMQRGYLCLHVTPYRNKWRWFQPWRWYCYASLDATPIDCVWIFGRKNYCPYELDELEKK